ncbi:c-type cytochrome [Dyadobacter fermentans]|jgi:mono/diheme cytochrome c family protein|uniref:c-type cytochrome n=1 Tax=Dyadobacter fermentans TaxID=94254 RepID=UPI001CC139CF|nr:c-type cytochrome [Dyadobacter fermentans]MBZ1361237.1 cytochrome c [Dyadobacter fermentans]
MDLKTGTILAALTLLAPGCKIQYKTEKINYNPSRANVREGKRLTMLVCGSCHYNFETKDFTGKKLEDSPKFLGKIYAANITQHPGQGAGQYTPGELVYLLRTGISRSGRLMPYMHRPNMAEEDLDAIIAYLKSDDHAVRPSDRNPGKTKYSPIGRLGLSFTKPGKYQDARIQKPGSDPILLGKYLVDNLACFHCHSKNFTSLDVQEPERSKGFMGGGNKLRNAAGKKIQTPNLTPHATGIANWTEGEFRRAVTAGISKDNSVISYPMPLFPELTEAETSAIFAYLKTIPPIETK